MRDRIALRSSSRTQGSHVSQLQLLLLLLLLLRSGLPCGFTVAVHTVIYVLPTVLQQHVVQRVRLAHSGARIIDTVCRPQLSSQSHRASIPPYRRYVSLFYPLFYPALSLRALHLAHISTSPTAPTNSPLTRPLDIQINIRLRLRMRSQK